MRVILSEIALCGAIFFCGPILAAQDIDNIVEQMAEQGATPEDVEDYLQQRGPLDLNAAGRQSLERSGLFTPFQIASLLEYRDEYGRLLSMAELQMVDGFTPEFVQRVSPYIYLGDAQAAGRSIELRSRYKYKGGTDGLHQYNRALLQSGSWKAGLLAESDPGEKPLIDYVGGYISYEKRRLKLLLGDYSACFGQGAALWTAFAFSGAGSPASLLRRQKGLDPYKSADESRALRGLALTYAFGGSWEASSFVSVRRVDAKVGDDGYVSLSKTGYHRTIYEKSCKGAMSEYVMGANICRRGDNIQAGITAAAYSYSEHNARKVEPYNQYQMYDGWCGNISADLLLSAGHWRIFAEAALCFNGRPAALAGAVVTPSYSFEASLMLRYYDKAYVAPHAGSYSSISTVSNQEGAALSLLLRPVKGLTLSSFTEAVNYPGIRYRVDAPSWAIYEKWAAEYVFSNVTLSIRDNYVFQSYEDSHKHSIKASIKLEEGSWKFSLRSGLTLLSTDGHKTRGAACSASATKSFFKGICSFTASAAYYNAAEYDVRVYLYESDLPGNFSLQYYYGKGIAAKCLAKVKAGRKLLLTGIAAYSGRFECRLQADLDF